MGLSYISWNISRIEWARARYFSQILNYVPAENKTFMRRKILRLYLEIIWYVVSNVCHGCHCGLFWLCVLARILFIFGFLICYVFLFECFVCFVVKKEEWTTKGTKRTRNKVLFCFPRDFIILQILNIDARSLVSIQ